MMFGRASGLCAALLLTFASLPPTELQAQIGLEEVTDLRFRGNHQFPDEVLAHAIVTRETECRSVLFKVVPFCLAGADFALDPYYLNQREFRRDQVRLFGFYWQRGYRTVRVDTVVTRPREGEVQLLFDIEEGDPVRVAELAFDGAESLPDSTVLEDLPLRVGDPLSVIALDAARDTLVTRLRDSGFAYAEVLRSYFIPRETPLEAEVAFEIYPGPRTRFGPLTIEGNRSVSEAVVRRMLPFRTGDLYSEALRFAGQRNLYNLDIFRFVDVLPDSAAAPDTLLPLTIRVAEGDVHRVRSGAGLSTAECLNAEVRWASRNFFGGARRLQLTGRVSNVLADRLEDPVCRDAGTGPYGDLNWLVSAEFTQPWLFSPRTSFSASLSGEHQSLPGIFVRQALALSVAVTHTLTLSTPLTFSYRPQLSSLEAAEVFFCSNYLICTPEDVRILQGANRLAPLGVSLSRDRRNQALSPTRGYSALVDLEHAASWTGSEFLYTRILADGTWYKQGGLGWVIAAHLRGGWVHPAGFRGPVAEGFTSRIVHPEKRLYAGGSNSVRGFAQNRLGPRVLQIRDVRRLLAAVRDDGSPVCTPASLLALSCDANGLTDDFFLPRATGGTSLLEGSVEFRVPVSGRIWELATFLDFGQVWDGGGGVDLRELQFTPGVGARYFSPIGPIRVDLAYRFQGSERLPVVTSQIRPYDPALGDQPEDRVMGPGGEYLDYVVSKELALLGPRVLWGDLEPWSLKRFQIHLSIGQAF